MNKRTEEFKADMAAKLAKFASEEKIYNMFPDAAGVSFACNLEKPDAATPRAWIVLESPSYDPENKFDPVGKLRAMEAAGWSMIDSAAVIQWDNYRRAIVPCTTTDAALYESPGHAYKKGDDSAPYWVVPSQHVKPKFCVFMRGPDGLIYRVSVAVPALRVGIFARRREFVGGWRFEPGTAEIRTPAAWPVFNSLTRGYVDTEQGISGTVYFDLLARKDTASAALSSLLEAQ